MRDNENQSRSAYAPLNRETRATVETACAAFHLNRKPDTLRAWAEKGTYPEVLTPLRLNRCLLWPVDGLRKLCGVSA